MYNQMRFTILQEATLPNCTILQYIIIQQMNTSQMLVFDESGKLEYPGKTSQSRVEKQQTQSTHDAECGN